MKGRGNKKNANEGNKNNISKNTDKKSRERSREKDAKQYPQENFKIVLKSEIKTLIDQFVENEIKTM